MTRVLQDDSPRGQGETPRGGTNTGAWIGVSTSRARLAAVTTTAASGFNSLRRFAAFETTRARRITRPVLETVTRLGWLVILCIGLSYVAGSLLGWQELLLAAATFLIVILVALGFIAMPAKLDVGVELNPRRVVAGNPAAGRAIFRNASRRRMTSLEVELPVGEGLASFRLPLLDPASAVEELFVIPTERRGVISVGPPASIRSDPLRLFVRRAPSGVATELIVHPKTIGLPAFGTGLLRDLEGLTTREVSPSDLAFHSLRDYVPGDDRRFIHWRSSAKTAPLGGALQVRQFLDTRRSALAAIVDCRPESYGDPEEFELALQVTGSLLLRAARDELQSLVVLARLAAMTTQPHILLDTLARAALDEQALDLAALAAQAAARGGDTTIAVLVTGSLATTHQMQRAAARFAPEVRVVALQARPQDPVRLAGSGRTTILQLPTLADLPLAIAGGVVG